MAVSTEAKVGIMIFLALIILASLTFTVSKINLFRRPGEVLKIKFADTGGLRLYDDVRIAGVIVGKVTDIYLEKDHAVVVIQLGSDYEIRKGAKAIINSAGLLGEAYISISQGPEGAPALDESSTPIESEPTIRVDQVMASFDRFMNKAQDAMDFNVRGVIKNTEDLLASVTNLINDNRESIKGISENLKDLTKGLSDGEREFQRELLEIMEGFDQYTKNLLDRTNDLSDAMVKSINSMDKMINENGRQISTLISNLNALNPELSSIVTSMAKTMKKVELVSARIEGGEGVLGKLTTDTELYDNLNSTLQEVKGLTSSLNKITLKIERGEGTLGKMATDDELYDNINKTMVSVQGLTGSVLDIKTYWGYRLEYRLLKQENQRDFRNTFFFLTEPRPGKSYRLELTDIGGKDRVSVLIGKQVYNWLTLRAGIIESTGGIGMRYHPRGDKLGLDISTFDFSRVSRPQVRIETDYRLSKNVHFRLGGDDLLLEKSYYAGLQVMVEDRDIKYILGLIPYAR